MRADTIIRIFITRGAPLQMQTAGSCNVELLMYFLDAEFCSQLDCFVQVGVVRPVLSCNIKGCPMPD